MAIAMQAKVILTGAVWGVRQLTYARFRWHRVGLASAEVVELAASS
jgi:hypothetical protein